MIDLWNSWIALSLDATRMAIDAHGVIGMRLIKVAEGGPQAETEMHRMVAEKSSAFVEAQIAMAVAVATGETHKAPAKVLRAYSRRVHANHRRLIRR